MSYLGAAFFFGLAAAWAGGRGVVSPATRALARVGVAASVFFLVVAIGEGLWCFYCIGAHVANLGAWLIAERQGERSRTGLRATPSLISFAAVALVVAGSLTLLDARTRRHAATTAERELAESAARLSEPTETASRPGRLAGRYRAGPENARVRVVVFTDYQCPDCRLVESRIEALLAERSDVSVTIRHFPFCTDCNPRAGRTLHPNACRAARAAEAAGLLAGPEGFWRMHRWLFDRAGAFGEADLRAALPALGFDPERFLAEMMSDRALAPISGDIDEAFGVGLGTTPMIFINGVELRGWSAPDALRRAADAAASAPQAEAAMDVPPGALDKLVNDWLEQPRASLPPGPRPWVRGSDGAKVRVVLFGDYQEPNCAEADSLLRGIVAGRSDASYQFRHFPLNPSCNPIARVAPHPLACRMAAAAEAAGSAGGDGAFWAAHEWLFANQRKFTDHGFMGALRPLGVEFTSLAEASAAPEIAGRILADCRAAEAVGVTEVPLIFVNERRVPRWTYQGLPVLGAIVDRAAAGE